MFKKKKKNDIILEDEVIIPIQDIKIQSDEKDDEEDIRNIEIITGDIIKDVELIEGDFTFYNRDPEDGCTVDEDEAEVDNKSKKELSTFFEKSKKDNSDIKESKAKEKRKSKRQKSKEDEFSKLKDHKVFVFRNKKYTNVEDFITFLDGHYLEIDKISQEVLDDENFHAWLSKKSGVFDDSIKLFKEIKEKIEKK